MHFVISDVHIIASEYSVTRSSADADNRLDAFNSGQSSPRHKWRHTYL